MSISVYIVECRYHQNWRLWMCVRVFLKIVFIQKLLGTSSDVFVNFAREKMGETDRCSILSNGMEEINGKE